MANDRELLERIRALTEAMAEGQTLPRSKMEPIVTDGYARALELDAECLRIEQRIDDLTEETAAGKEVPGEELEDGDGPPLGTHEFRWDHAIAAGRRIFRDDFPTDVTVILIEAETLALGVGLAPRVETAAAKVADRVAALVAPSRAVMRPPI